MKYKELCEKFDEYCKVYGLIIDHSHHHPQTNEYVLAKADSVYLTRNDPRAGNTYGIMMNSGHGTISVMYGWVNRDTMYGFLQGAITAKRNHYIMGKPK